MLRFGLSAQPGLGPPGQGVLFTEGALPWAAAKEREQREHAPPHCLSASARRDFSPQRPFLFFLTFFFFF